MIEIHDLYFKWLMDLLGNANLSEQRLCLMLDENVFRRRVGNDINRANDGLNLRRRFLEAYDEVGIEPLISNAFLEEECSWLEMLVALSDRLDYLYEGEVRGRFLEMIQNLGLSHIATTAVDPSGHSVYDEADQTLVDQATNRVDTNRFDINGAGGLFPLVKPHHPDQRGVEIWAQLAAYFSERLEGVVWTSTN